MASIELPTWKECGERIDNETADALDRFIFDNEPAEGFEPEEWRKALAEAISCV